MDYGALRNIIFPANFSLDIFRVGIDDKLFALTTRNANQNMEPMLKMPVE